MYPWILNAIPESALNESVHRVAVYHCCAAWRAEEMLAGGKATGRLRSVAAAPGIGTPKRQSCPDGARRTRIDGLWSGFCAPLQGAADIWASLPGGCAR